VARFLARDLLSQTKMELAIGLLEGTLILFATLTSDRVRGTITTACVQLFDLLG